MSRMRARILSIALAALVLASAGASANDLGFSGGVGLDITYTPVPPTSYNIGSDLELSFSVSGFSFLSETGFDLSGFQSERVTIGVDLGAVQIFEEILFNPYFGWNELSVDLAIVGVEIGMDWILANIGSTQTPDYSMGMVVQLGSGIVCGFSINSLTGFGATDLVNMLGGIDAPFSYELLCLFNHLAGLCTPAVDLDVTIVSGFYFEEELVRLEVDYEGLVASNTTWFDTTGLSRMLFELGYRFEDPAISFVTSLEMDGAFVITGLEFIVDLQIDVVRFTSHTVFDEPPIPLVIPIVFASQGFAVSFSICGVDISMETDFDNAFFFAQQLIAIEAELEPVSFASLTTFDASGFAGQCVYADVTFCGVVLFTQAEFDYAGIEKIVFGFDFTF